MTFELETKRLRLRVPSMADYEDLLALRTDPDVMRSAVNTGIEFGSGEIQTEAQVNDHTRLAKGYFDEYGIAFFCAYEKETGNFIGQAGLFHWGYNLEQDDIELAYRLHKKYWGRGYATELAIALIDWGFNVRKLPKIIAPVHPENKPSVNVLKKAGMTYNGEINHKDHILACYVIYKEKS